jgi:hypothetical protein
MNTADVLRKWETYAYRLAFHITREERRAAAMAAEALFASRLRLANAATESEAEAELRRAVLRQAVAAICDCLEGRGRGMDGERSPEATKNGSPI